MELPSITTIIFATIGGFIPALIWLLFWHKQDHLTPEPKHMIILTFLGGTLAVLISLFLEKKLYYYDFLRLLDNIGLPEVAVFIKNFAIEQGINVKRLCIVAFFAPIVEETSKFVTTFAISLKTRHNDEAPDPIIYMITGALGFAFLENVLFLIDPIVKQDTVFTVLTADVRFIGATLLHATASAIVGMTMAFSFFRGRTTRTLAKIVGLSLAIVLHAFFNLFIIMDKGNEAMKALIGMWIVVVIILFLFEKIKSIKLNKI